MQVRLLYFAALKDLMGTGEESATLPVSVHTVADLLAHLRQVKPALAPRLDSCRIAVNEEFAQAGDTIEPDSDIALIPPVSGG